MIAGWVTQFVVLVMVALYVVLTIMEALGKAQRPTDVILFTKWCLAAALGIDTFGRLRLLIQARKERLRIDQKNKEDKSD